MHHAPAMHTSCAMQTHAMHIPCAIHAHAMHVQVMRRLIDDLVSGIKQHFKARSEKQEREEISLKDVQTLAKKWSSRCVP